MPKIGIAFYWFSPRKYKWQMNHISAEFMGNAILCSNVKSFRNGSRISYDYKEQLFLLIQLGLSSTLWIIKIWSNNWYNPFNVILFQVEDRNRELWSEWYCWLPGMEVTRGHTWLGCGRGVTWGHVSRGRQERSQLPRWRRSQILYLNIQSLPQDVWHSTRQAFSHNMVLTIYNR